MRRAAYGRGRAYAGPSSAFPDAVLAGQAATLGQVPGAALVGSGAVWLSNPTYGAAGDLATDDSAALTAALAALPSSGGTVHVTGTHIVSGVGSSKALTIRLHPGAMLKLKAGGSSILSLTGSWVEIVGPGVIDGNQANAGGDANSDLVLITGALWADINATVQNAKGNGLTLSGVAAGRIRGKINEAKGHGCKAVDSHRIEFDAKVTNTDKCGYIVIPSTTDVYGHTTRGVFDTNGRASDVSNQYPSVYWNSYGSNTLQVKHSRFEPRVTNAGWVGGFPAGQYNVVGAGTYVSGAGLVYAPTGHALWLHSSGDVTIEKGVELTGSVRYGLCIQNTPKVRGMGGAIYLNALEGVSIEAITGTGPYDSTVANDEVWLEGYVIKNNGTSAASTYAGVMIKGYTNVTLNKNQITDDQGSKTQLRAVTVTDAAGVQNAGNLDFLYNNCAGNVNTTIFSLSGGSQLRRARGNSAATQDTERLATASYTSASIAAGATSPILSGSSSGAAAGMHVRVVASVFLPDGCIAEGAITASNTVHMWIRNTTAGALTPSSCTLTGEFYKPQI